jgi:hypothetical protein
MAYDYENLRIKNIIIPIRASKLDATWCRLVTSAGLEANCRRQICAKCDIIGAVCDIITILGDGGALEVVVLHVRQQGTIAKSITDVVVHIVF